MSKQNPFAGMAFPIIRVRYAGPTNHRGSCYIATLRGIRFVRPLDYELSGSENAYQAALECWKLYQDGVGGARSDYRERVFIPGDLSDDSYCFTLVPAGLITVA